MVRYPTDRRLPALLLATALTAAACTSDRGSSGTEEATAPSPTSGSSSNPSNPSTTIEDYPDAQTRALRRLAAAPRPVPRSALPPRHLDADRFPETLVDRSLIVSGGVAVDAIPPVDEPWFEAVADVDWLTDDEAVLAIEVDGRARAYPIQVMILHEIVNDTIDDTPVTVTYCPLCNSGVAFDRRLDGQVLDFGISGGLYQSALVMYDRQTESLWTHFDGRAVVGDLLGGQLELLPLSTVAWHDFRDAHPDGEVLGRIIPGFPYGNNPYGSYDSSDRPLSGFFRGEIDDRLAPMHRVVGLQVSGGETAVALDRLREAGVLAVDVDGRRAVVVWTPGAVSALDANRVDEGDDLGATGAFWTERDLRIAADDDSAVIDQATGERWNILGTPLTTDGGAEALEAVTHLDTFWFAWSTYHPSTTVLD